MKFSPPVVLYLIFLFDFNQISTAEIQILNLLFGSKGNKTFSIIEESVGNTECARDLRIFFNDLAQKKQWALQMFDATGKYPGGFLAGHIHIWGNFDQCLQVRNDEVNPPILGQYCKMFVKASENHSSHFVDTLLDPGEFVKSIGIKINNNTMDMLMQLLKISYGLCIPHSCSSDNLRNISQHAENTLKLPIQMEIYDFNCRNKEKAILPFYFDKYIISFFCAYTALLLISTCYDIMIDQSAKGNDNILVAFSVLRNGKQLFSPPDNTENRLGALNGLKVLQMLWIILGHRYIFNALSGVTNFVYLREWKHNISTSFLQSASYAVDTFLVLSGLLLSYFFLKHMDGNKKRQFPILKMYLYRYLRLSPSLLAMILFYISIFKNLGDGPDWVQIVGRFSVACTRTWWATLLFINNYLDHVFSCVEHSWYLAVDSQLFFLSPILLINLNKRPWKTCLACVVICVCSGIYTYIITVQQNLGALLFEANKEYLVKMYYPTQARMPPWFIGIIFGFLIHTYGNIKLNMVNKVLAWTFTLLLLYLPICVQLFLNRADEYSAVNSALCNSCTRQIWGIGIGIFSFLCASGNGGIINEFLSLPIFQILVRFCYSMYLTHVPVMAYFIAERRHPEYFATVKVAHQVMGDLPFIFLASTIWTLAFESPFRVIGKLLNKKDITIENNENPRNGTNSREENKKDTKKVKVSPANKTNDCKKIR